MRGLIWSLFIVLLLGVFACSKGSSLSTAGGAAPSEGVPSFRIELIDGSDSIVLVTGVVRTAGGYDVTVSAAAGSRANDVFFKLTYDSGELSPGDVNFAGALGESVDLAISSIAGEVSVGMSRIRSSEEPPAAVEGVLVTIHFESGSSEGKVLNQVPNEADDKITDLASEDLGGGVFRVTWKERNLGDYNNSGDVTIADVAAIAVNYLSSEPANLIELVDGSGDGEVNIADVGTIARKYLNSIDGHLLYVLRNSAWEAIPNPDNPAAPFTVDRPDDPPYDRVITYSFDYTLDAGDEDNFRARPVGMEGDLGLYSNASGGEVVTVPSKVTGFTIHSGSAYGAGAIHLEWNPVFDEYLDHFVLFSEEGGDGTNLTVLPGYDNITPDASSADLSGLSEGVTYHFAIWGVNTEGTPGALSDVVNGSPWYETGPPPKITDLNAVGAEEYGEGVIHLEWTKPETTNLDKYELWHMEEGDPLGLQRHPDYQNIIPSGGDLEVLDVHNCVKNVTYIFALWGVNEEGNGPISDESGGAQAWYDVPPIPPVEILEVTRNKTTFDSTETIELAVVTNLDGTEHEGEQTFSWNVIAGSADITSGGDSRNALAKVTGASTVTFEITVEVPATGDSASDTIMVVGTGLPYLGNVYELGGDFLFIEESYYHGTDYPFQNYVDDQHVILFNLWDIECGWCLFEFPFMQDIYDTLTGEGEDYYHIGVSDTWGGDNRAQNFNYYETSEWTWTDTFWDQDNGARYAYGGEFNANTGSLPQSFLLDRDGSVRYSVVGAITSEEEKNEMLARIRELLGEDFVL